MFLRPLDRVVGDNAYAVVDVLTEGCEVWGYGSVIDGVAAFPGTDDATIIPMKRGELQKDFNPSLTVFKLADFITTNDVMGHNWIPDSQATLTIDNGLTEPSTSNAQTPLRKMVTRGFRTTSRTRHSKSPKETSWSFPTALPESPTPFPI